MKTDVRTCPFCRGEIRMAETTCPHCRIDLATGLRFAREHRPTRRGMPRWGIALMACSGGLLILGALAAIAIVLWGTIDRGPIDRNAAGSLKTIATAQADFRSNDRDNNGVNDFWTGDIAGLYWIDNSSAASVERSHIKLIEPSVAMADLWGSTPKGCTVQGVNNYSTSVITVGPLTAKAGYWYLALYGDPGAPYRQSTGGAEEANHNSTMFGAAALPEKHGNFSRWVYIVNERNVIYKRDFGHDLLSTSVYPPILTDRFDGRWPSDSDLRRWTRMD